jgi:hypothetical protein
MLLRCSQDGGDDSSPHVVDHCRVHEVGVSVTMWTTWSKARGLFHSIVPGAIYSDKDAGPAEGKNIYTVDTVRTKR